MKHLWLRLDATDLQTEQLQCEQEGRDLSVCAASLNELHAADLETESGQGRAHQLLDALRATSSRADYPFVEPEDLSHIREARPSGRFARSALAGGIEDRLQGAWFGRCAGCLLGKPVEGWKREQIKGYLHESDQAPLSYYISIDSTAAILEKHNIDRSGPFIENVTHMPEDDDMNYTTVGLAILEAHGRDFSCEDVANLWLDRIPILRTCTAERIAYRNFANGIMPPASARFRNPYREWIGAQIRADMWGYVNPGNPELAAEYAWRDARISHIRNGIYGEMWVAAMIAAAFVQADMPTVIHAGLGEVPEQSRIAAAIRGQLENRQKFSHSAQAVDEIHTRWNENRAHDWCHVIPNAEIVAMALLWGDQDFERSICLAVEAGFDTDCNGATVGSVLGAMQGKSFLPERWIHPLNDTLETGVQGFHRVSISHMAKRTLAVSMT